MKGGKLLRAGKLTQQEIGNRLGVSRVSVNNWKQQLESEGLKGLKAQVSSGRPGKLSFEQKQKLLKVLSQGAIAAGYVTDRWTQERVKQVIRAEFGVEYHAKYIARLLKQLDWSPQVPLDLAIERDEELVEAWLKKDWPRIKKITSVRAGHRVYG